jgi:hypothetical protein
MAVATDLLPAHVAVAYARGQSPACGAVLQQLRLPALSELIQKLPHQEWLQGDGLHPQMPHERLAIALAARTAAAPGESNAASSPADHGARITPTHWSAHANHIDLTDPAGLQLTAQESQALCAAMAPYFVEDGLQLAYQEPLVWHAQSSLFAGLELPSLDRALGRSLLDWIPRAPQAAPLRRLQQEMQMLLYTHPVNESRLSRGLLPVNSFWISRHLPSVAGLHLDDRLRRSAIAEDWRTWLQTWEQIDADLCAPLLARAQAGHLEPVRRVAGGHPERAPRPTFACIQLASVVFPQGLVAIDPSEVLAFRRCTTERSGRRCTPSFAVATAVITPQVQQAQA